MLPVDRGGRDRSGKRVLARAGWGTPALAPIRDPSGVPESVFLSRPLDPGRHRSGVVRDTTRFRAAYGAPLPRSPSDLWGVSASGRAVPHTAHSPHSPECPRVTERPMPVTGFRTRFVALRLVKGIASGIGCLNQLFCSGLDEFPVRPHASPVWVVRGSAPRVMVHVQSYGRHKVVGQCPPLEVRVHDQGLLEWEWTDHRTGDARRGNIPLCPSVAGPPGAGNRSLARLVARGVRGLGGIEGSG